MAVFVIALFLSSGLHAQAPKNRLSHHEREFEHEQELFERSLFDRERSADPVTGRIPADIPEREREFVRELRASAPQPSIQKVFWDFRAIGPRNVGGRTRAFGVDYTNPNVMIAGGVTGGMWRSIDGGETWSRISPTTDILNVSCLAQHPTNPAVWYAGTGEVLSTTERRSSMLLRTISTGTGVYKSVDNGVTWNRITPLFSSEYNSLKEDFQGIWAVVPGGPSDGNELYVACTGGIYAFDGVRFSRILGDTVRRSFNTEIVASPDRSVWYAACGATDEGTAPTSYGIWRRDAQGTWKKITPTPFPTAVRRFRMAISASNPNVMYVFTQAPSSYANRYLSFSSVLTLWRYTDDGKGTGVWENRKAWLDSTRMNTLAGYALTLAVHPENDSLVVIAGTDAYLSTSGFAKAKDALHLGGYPYIVEPGRLHPDIHHLSFSTTKPYVLYSAGDGGLSYTSEWRKEDGYWRTLNNGYNVTQAYHASQDHFVVRDSIVSVSLQDNSNYITNSPGSDRGWTHCGGGDGTCTAVMPDASLIFASSQYASVYAFRLNAGEPDYTAFDAPLAADSISAQFVNMFLLVQRRALRDTVFVMPVGNRLFFFPQLSKAYEQVSYRRAWVEVPGLQTQITGGARISALGMSQYDDATVFVGTTSGRVFQVSMAATQSVVTPLPDLPVKGFVASLDGDEDGNVIVALSNYNVRSMFLLMRGATSWRDISDELERGTDTLGWGPGVRSCRFVTHPTTGTRYILAGTTVGLFAREMNDTSLSPWRWIAVSTIGNAIIESIDVRHADSRIIIGTHGVGVYESVLKDDTNGVDTSASQIVRFDDPYPNPVREACFLRYSIPVDGHVRLRMFDSRGVLVATLVDEVENAGGHVIELDRSMFLSKPQGAYYFKLEAAGRAITKMATFVR